MLVLVTGCTGRIGPSVLKDLASSGYNIRGLLEPGCQVPDGARDYLDQIQYGDIRNAEDWRKALEDVDAVVHLAAISADVPGVFDTCYDPDLSRSRGALYSLRKLQLRSWTV